MAYYDTEMPSGHMLANFDDRDAIVATNTIKFLWGVWPWEVMTSEEVAPHTWTISQLSHLRKVARLTTLEHGRDLLRAQVKYKMLYPKGYDTVLDTCRQDPMTPRNPRTAESTRRQPLPKAPSPSKDPQRSQPQQPTTIDLTLKEESSPKGTEAVAPLRHFAVPVRWQHSLEPPLKKRLLSREPKIEGTTTIGPAAPLLLSPLASLKSEVLTKPLYVLSRCELWVRGMALFDRKESAKDRAVSTEVSLRRAATNLQMARKVLQKTSNKAEHYERTYRDLEIQKEQALFLETEHRRITTRMRTIQQQNGIVNGDTVELPGLRDATLDSSKLGRRAELVGRRRAIAERLFRELSRTEELMLESMDRLRASHSQAQDDKQRKVLDYSKWHKAYCG
ncbi:hypothetical protein BKA67DRAFT_542504 [Truncatella angustata]|uniref:Uncharacterized protein n=1 Tax=Truncatella angustata TaxID=152316 RepID=A0A9P8RET7_9PEZI|nr:uncharacterized protein BKA67DRAFT_542504 [Truncatella angustata]KAH6639974.1 hypothetical protein BKA67DRAFT_542504 [Truncatella angustata]KAH8200651.1 hypothetical protein TruAng_005188 [Truncatella angustata]